MRCPISEYPLARLGARRRVRPSRQSRMGLPAGPDALPATSDIGFLRFSAPPTHAVFAAGAWYYGKAAPPPLTYFAPKTTRIGLPGSTRACFEEKTPWVMLAAPSLPSLC